MRLVVWNCGRGPFREKFDAALAYGPDLLVLSESAEPDSAQTTTQWFADGRYGTVVWAPPGIELERLPTASLPCCVNPLRVTIHDQAIHLLAVWTWRAPTYKRAFSDGLDAYAHLLGSAPSIVAGDFNGHPSFDGPRMRVSWRRLFHRLEALGLRSAYHAFHDNLPMGFEPHATHFHKRDPGRPFHIDYCFIPQLWCDGALRVAIPPFTDVPCNSDHAPLIIDVAL